MLTERVNVGETVRTDKPYFTTALKTRRGTVSRFKTAVILSEAKNLSPSPLALDYHLSGIAYVARRVKQNARTDRLP